MGLTTPALPALAQDELTESPEATLGEEAGSEDSGDDDARAREQFKLGQAAYEDGDYRSAWEHFHKAYMLSKRPELLYNVGQTADRLRRDREALKAFRMYLQRVPDAENHREVENRVRVLEERVAADEGSGEGEASEQDSPFKKVSADDKPFDGDAEPTDDEDAPPAPPGSQPLRTGWYFRGSLGLGAFRAPLSPAAGGAGELTLSSSAFSGEIAVGHQLVPGIVLGGAIFFDFGLAPKVEDLEIDRANVTMLGVLADWYLRPDRDGLHLEAAIAGGSLSARDSGGSASVSPEAMTGGALLAGGGYEWALQDDWALGVLGRVTLASLSNDVFDTTLIAISAQATATWF